MFAIRKNMTSYFLKFFKKKSNRENFERVYTLDDYDDTFVIAEKIMKFVTIQMTHNLSDIRAKCWKIFFWFEVLSIVLIAIPAELVRITLTALQARGFTDAINVFRLTPCVGSCMMSSIKGLNLQSNTAVFVALYHELREIWPRGKVSGDEHRIINSALKQLNLIVKGYYWCNNFLLLSYLSPPLIICVRRLLGYDNRKIFSFDYWLPFDHFQPYIFEIVLVLQTWQATVVIYWNVLWDILFCTYLAHISMQFDLLACRVRRLFYVPVDMQLPNSYPLAKISGEFIFEGDEAFNSYTDHEWQVRHQKELVDIVKRHHTLIRLAGNVESIFSFALLINFVYSSILICFCGFYSFTPLYPIAVRSKRGAFLQYLYTYEALVMLGKVKLSINDPADIVLIEKWNEIAYKTFLITALAETWLLCWYGQRLLDSSLGVSLALYESGWYRASKRIKSSLLIMLKRTQNDVHLTTFGFSKVSLSSFSAIVKTAWSYFTLLVNLALRTYTVEDFTDEY